MKHLIVAMVMALAVLIVGACAQGPSSSRSVLTLPPPPAGQGRVFVFRTGDLVGALNQPTVMMNGRVIGKAVPGRYFYIDVAPGNYTVQTVTEPGKRASFSLGPGGKAYVRLNSYFAGVQQVYPELVSEFSGLTDMQGLSYGR